MRCLHGLEPLLGSSSLPSVLGSKLRAPAYICTGNGAYAGKGLSHWTRYSNGVIDQQAHNIYGLSETHATNVALRDLRPGKRPFILSRSTFAGSGRTAAHWLGDNMSTWRQMWLSMQGVLQFQLYGIPMVGADVCPRSLCPPPDVSGLRLQPEHDRGALQSLDAAWRARLSVHVLGSAVRR